MPQQFLSGQPWEWTVNYRWEIWESAGRIMGGGGVVLGEAALPIDKWEILLCLGSNGHIQHILLSGQTCPGQSVHIQWSWWSHRDGLHSKCPLWLTHVRCFGPPVWVLSGLSSICTVSPMGSGCTRLTLHTQSLCRVLEQDTSIHYRLPFQSSSWCSSMHFGTDNHVAHRVGWTRSVVQLTVHIDEHQYWHWRGDGSVQGRAGLLLLIAAHA